MHTSNHAPPPPSCEMTICQFPESRINALSCHIGLWCSPITRRALWLWGPSPVLRTPLLAHHGRWTCVSESHAPLTHAVGSFLLLEIQLLCLYRTTSPVNNQIHPHNNQVLLSSEIFDSRKLLYIISSHLPYEPTCIVHCQIWLC